MARKLVGTTIINETTQPVLIKGGSHARDYCVFHRLLPEKTYTLEYFLNDNNVYSFTFAVGDTMIPVYPDDGPGHFFLPDDLARAEEIIIHETLNRQEIGWRISKERGRSQEYQYLADFDAFSTSVRKDVSSRTETIETSCTRLKNLLKEVDICPTQCKNLVQICSKGVAKMIEFYIAVSKNDNYMWGLYTSKKLRHLVSSLDRLISSLEPIEDLLQACGNQWCRMGLVVSAFPLPCPEKTTFTKFDLLIKELMWNLDTIYFILDLTEDGKLIWNDDKCRYVLEKEQGTGIAGEVGMEPVECGTDVDEARADLLVQIKGVAIIRNLYFRFVWILSSFVISSPLIWSIAFGILNVSFDERFVTLVLYCSYVLTRHPATPSQDYWAKVVRLNIFGVRPLSMGGRKWYELSFEGGAAYLIIVKIQYYLICGLAGCVFGVNFVFLVARCVQTNVLDTSRPFFRFWVNHLLPALVCTYIYEALMSIISTKIPFPGASFIWIEGLCCLFNDLLLFKSEPLGEDKFPYIFALYWGGFITLLNKIGDRFVKDNVALTLLGSIVRWMIAFNYIFFGFNRFLGIKSNNNERFILIYLTADLIEDNKNEMVWSRGRSSYLTILTLHCLYIAAAHVLNFENGFFQNENVITPILISSKEVLVLWAICFTLLLGAAQPLEDWLERCGRTYFPQYGERRYFEEDVLKRRLQYSGKTNKSVESSIAPICFQIDHEHLKLETRIAGGSPRPIYRGYWHGQEVAIAITQNLEVDEYSRKSESREIREEIQKIAAMMLRLQHPNIVDFFGYAFKPDKSRDSGGSCDDEPVAAGYLVMELMQGDLRQVIDRLVLKQPGRPFPDDVAVDILLQIAGAMSHMHDCGVLYRDLKAKNCVVSQRSSSQSNSQVLRTLYTVKLIDFDISKLLDQNATDHTLMRGTTRWMAPEVWGIGVYVPGVLVQQAPYDTSVDVYSFGMTCYEVITGLHPFHRYRRIDEIRVALGTGERPEFPPGMSCPRALEELMSRCWAEEPSARPNFKEIVKALWTIKYELELQQ